MSAAGKTGELAEHTPTPWELFHSNGIISIRNPRSRESHNEIVFWSGFDASHYPKQALANAAFIVRAVNNIDDLIACVRASLNMIDGDGLPPDWDFLRHTLASASPSLTTAERSA